MRRRVSVQEGSPPPLACTEVGFFYMDIYIHTHTTRTCIRARTWIEGEQEDEDENEDEKDEEEEIGTDIRGHTEFLTSPGSL